MMLPCPYEVSGLAITQANAIAHNVL
jgi:hypothetical protein